MLSDFFYVCVDFVGSMFGNDSSPPQRKRSGQSGADSLQSGRAMAHARREFDRQAVREADRRAAAQGHIADRVQAADKLVAIATHLVSPSRMTDAFAAALRLTPERRAEMTAAWNLVAECQAQLGNGASTLVEVREWFSTQDFAVQAAGSDQQAAAIDLRGHERESRSFLSGSPFGRSVILQVAEAIGCPPPQLRYDPASD